MSVASLNPVTISEHREALTKIKIDDCNLAIWQRDAPVDVSWIFASESEPKDLRITVPSDNPEAEVRAALDRCGYPENSARELLISDILLMCKTLHELTCCFAIEVRLEIVSGNSCWKFHSDYVKMRLITTYLGRGTQWIDAYNGRRAETGLKPEAINELRAGDVGIFKGRLGTSLPAIHRSPPIGDTGEKRLLLVLNPIEEIE